MTELCYHFRTLSFLAAIAQSVPACRQAGSASSIAEQLIAAIAQSVERFHGKEEVSGSNPDRGSRWVGTQAVNEGRL